ncbi:hypothetical protein EHW61_16060 [Salinivibrio sp. VYel6]|uniref:hypothetical protein n=1 Tax=Salinivibrio sp. VYel6 TaxID=2490493 RepID=UPI001562A63A|nr:hypothetical protein [Salinivibrio sp. VYel6]MPX98144.1 hypothetical protein [Salinivibrio sp. VYel6]
MAAITTNGGQKISKTKEDVLSQLDLLLAKELLERTKSGVATASELREARAYLNDNKDLLNFNPEHPAHEITEHLPDVAELPEVYTH